jgi:hypothetical protein
MAREPSHYIRWATGRPPNAKVERNRRIFDEWFSERDVTMGELSRREGLSRQRISKIIQAESRRRNLPSGVALSVLRGSGPGAGESQVSVKAGMA